MAKNKYDPNFFEIPFRPAFEFTSAGGWLLAAGATVLALASPFPHFPFKVAGLVCLTMGVIRLMEGYPYWRELRALRKREPVFTSLKHLQRMMRKPAVDSFYIGEGYVLDSTAAERIYEMVRRGPERILPAAATLGCPWLQRIKKPSPQFIPVKFLEGQTLLVGATGAGKTVSFRTFVTQAVARGDAVVIIDPKGDKGLQAGAQEACQELGQPDRFVYFNPAFPETSARIDPLANWNRTTEPASRLAALIPSETGSDPFSAFGWNCLNAIGQALIYLGDTPNLLKFVRYIEGTPEDLVIRAMRKCFDTHIGPKWEAQIQEIRKSKHKEGEVAALAEFYRQRVAKLNQSRTIESLLSVYEHNREHFGKMVASLIPILNMLTTPPLDRLLSPSDFFDRTNIVTNFSDIINAGQVVYCALDALSDKTIGSALGSMFLADLTAVAGDRYNYGVDETRRVWIYVDEANEVMNDPCIQILNKGRGSYFHVMLATQTLADFEARTGSAAKARMVLGNVNNTFCMRVKDGETRDYVAEKLPKTYVRSFRRSFTGGTGSSDVQHFRGGYTEAVDQEEVTMLPPNLLESLPDWEYIATFTDGRVVKGLMPITKRPRETPKAQRPRARDIDQSVDPNELLSSKAAQSLAAPTVEQEQSSTPRSPTAR